MAYDEDGYYRDDKAQEQFKGAMGEAMGAAIDGRYQLMPKTFRNVLSKSLDQYNDNTLDLSTRPLRGLSKQAAMYALIKKARAERLEKEANPFQNMGQYAGQGWGQLFDSNTGMMRGLPGPQSMYPTALGAGAGYMLGNQFGFNPWGSALMGGGLSYLLNNWMKSQHQKNQQNAAPAATPAAEAAPADDGQNMRQLKEVANDGQNMRQLKEVTPETKVKKSDGSETIYKGPPAGNTPPMNAHQQPHGTMPT